MSVPLKARRPCSYPQSHWLHRAPPPTPHDVLTTLSWTSKQQRLRSMHWNPQDSDSKLSSFQTTFLKHSATVTESCLTQWGWPLFLKPEMDKQWDFRVPRTGGNGKWSQFNRKQYSGSPREDTQQQFHVTSNSSLRACQKELKARTQAGMYTTRSIATQCRFLNLSFLNLKCGLKTKNQN